MNVEGEDLFSRDDQEQMAALGVSEDEARRQIALFRNPPRPMALLRPCTIGDGITRLEEAHHPERLAAWSEAARSGRLMTFVPASGAASRMFETLLVARAGEPDPSLPALRARAEADPNARDAIRLVDELPRFAFRDELEAELRRRGRSIETIESVVELLAALLDDDGFGYATLPKALIPFHRYGSTSRTPFEEHLTEAARTVVDAAGRARLHFTIAGEFRERFDARLAAARPALESALATALAVEFSEQAHATDTIAVDPENNPFRGPDGRIVFRPGGHGALLHNLARVGGDVVLVKNIDNIQHESRAGTTILWRKLLAGHFILLERRVHELERRLASENEGDAASEGADETVDFLCGPLGLREAAGLRALHIDERRLQALDRLRRPLRVCGVVKNQGEPGGGPFWVAGEGDRESCQIVESSQVDLSRADQRAIWDASSHFNPVDLVLGLRRPDGGSYDLDAFVNPATVFIAKKSKHGRELKALERPGLWNGAMAGWNTVFVEVPSQTFSPVKTVFDLLRPEHQPAPTIDEHT